MSETSQPPPQIDPSELPSVSQLLQASAGAVFLGSALVITMVLPAEYGVDPTGFGSVFGLTEMGLMKQGVAPDGVYGQHTDTVSLTLKPGQGAEIKAVMRNGDTIDFSWTTDNGPLFFEFHGDPKGKPGSEFVSYEKTTKAQSKGVFTAAFEGKHGWYWRNENKETVTVVLTTSGVYQSVSRQ